MALALLNGYVAVRGPEKMQSIMKGNVIMVASDVTIVAAGDKVYYSADSGKTVEYNGVEVILIQAAEIIAKI